MMKVDEGIRSLWVAILDRALRDARCGLRCRNTQFFATSKARKDFFDWYTASADKLFSYRWLMHRLRFSAKKRKMIDDELRKSPVFN